MIACYQKYHDGEMMEDKEEGGSDELVSTGIPPFQSLLMDFLDHRAPLLGKHQFNCLLCCSCEHQFHSLLYFECCTV